MLRYFEGLPPGYDQRTIGHLISNLPLALGTDLASKFGLPL
jgi:hypothetical protein